MIVSWPARITSTGVRRQYVHAIDIVPTLYSVLGIEPPEVVKAGQYGALPLENRNVVEILTTDRPQLTKPRSRYVYYPGIAEVLPRYRAKYPAVQPGRVAALRGPA
jgi:arylsulfatase A-like enzyme